jgi:tryptophan synthase alpha chain
LTSSGPAITEARDQGRGALIGYLPAGFPSVAGAIEAFSAMADAGIDVIEVGLPYSDPVMDGPTIQAACASALSAGVRTRDVLRTVEVVAASGIPTLVMTYWNPIERYGVEAFAADLAGVGGAGLITPDLIPDEAGTWLAAADQHDLDKVFLVSPSSTDERLAMTASHCRGFVYATAVMGVTGAREQTSDAAPRLVSRTRSVTSLPVGVGLGVSDAAQAAAVADYADAVIVGSALVRRLLDATDRAAGLREVAGLTTALASGVRRRTGTPQKAQLLDRS